MKLEETDLRLGGLVPRQGRYPLQLRRLRRRAESAQSAVTHRRRRFLLNSASNCVKTSKDTASSCSCACSLPCRGRRACGPSPPAAGPERCIACQLDIDSFDINHMCKDCTAASPQSLRQGRLACGLAPRATGPAR